MLVLVWTVVLFTSSAGVEHTKFDLEREDLGTASSFRPTSPTAQRAMDQLLCQCPGCQPKHITIADCACGYAARQREEVLAVVAEYDVATATGRAQAERAALDDQARRYGRQVWSEPASATAWLLPVVACLGGLGFVYARGRRAPETAAIAIEDPELADRLDDELAELD